MNASNYKIDKDFIVNELKVLGIKYTKKKEKNKLPDKLTRKRIFKTHLHLLELTDVILANGEIVQIPSFVSDCCERILEQVDTEGIFRKAGSTSRQKQIRTNVEAGLQLGINHHVIDIGNVLKSFFRELPEPLLAPYIQETLLRSYLIVEGKLNAILLSCLLLPPLTINTLAYFMQFLYTVSLNIEQNRMSIENLAIIFAPSLMPANDLTSIRFNNHVKIIQLLIQHSSSIGIVPDYLIPKLSQHCTSTTSVKDLSSTEINKKKKKRRSGSLTRMFHGIKKMVGAIGSSENLESNSDSINSVTTPYISKATKKRKLTDNGVAFSAKKKNDLIGLLPDRNLLPNTPICTKPIKKSRISLGGKRTIKDASATSSNVERRWSIVGSGWTKKKIQSFVNNETQINNLSKPLSPVVSLPNLPKINLDEQSNTSTSNPSINNSCPDTSIKSLETDYLKISKKEYEEIKGRVATIEKRISREFGEINSLLINENEPEIYDKNESDDMNVVFMSGPERVLNKFEQINDETASHQMSPSLALANRLSRELKICLSDKIIRSPSARKIGSIRRRSRENLKTTKMNKRLSRNASWHFGSNSKSPSINKEDSYISTANFYPKSNLKRGRPNTVQTGLCIKTSENEIVKDEDHENIDSFSQNENWISGEVFFEKTPAIEFVSPSTKNKFYTPLNTPEKFLRAFEIDDKFRTPMLPPQLIPSKDTFKTPMSTQKSNKKPKSNLRKFKESPYNIDELNGRASIVRLRAVNAGQVMAKAKLFDNLNENDAVANVPKINSAELRRRSAVFIKSSGDKPIYKNNKKNVPIISKIQQNEKLTPGHNTILSKTPGKIQKQRRVIATKYPNQKLSEIVLDEEILTPKNINSMRFKQFRNMSCNSTNEGKNLQLTPKIKKNLKINSPRKLLKTPKLDKDHSNCRTPIKATQISIRKSPRFTLYN